MSPAVEKVWFCSGSQRLLKELLRSNDLVYLSWIRFIFNEACIQIFVLDEHMSVLEGSANAIPRRVMVSEQDHEQAVKLMKNAKSGLDI
jgi:hypothetical protein